MRKLFTLLVVALCPVAARATVVINVEQIVSVPTGADQTVYIEVFLRDLDNTNEQLNAFSLALDAPLFSPNGIRFGPPENGSFPTPVGHPYVFGAFSGVVPEDFGSTYNRIQVGAGTSGQTQNVDVTDALNGLVRIPIIIPANAPWTFNPVVVDIGPSTAFAGAGAPIVRTAGVSGGLVTIPEPTSAGTLLAAVAAAALSRPRRDRR